MSTDPRKLIVQNAFMLQRIANSISRDNDALIRSLYNEIAALMVKIDPTAVSAASYRRDRVAKLIEGVQRLVPETMGDVYKGTRAELARLGVQQGQQASALLVASVGTDAAVKMVAPSVNMMKAIIDLNPFQGETLAGWVKEVQSEAIVRRVRQEIQKGMSAEESIDSMVRRVRGKSDGRGGYTGGVMETTTKEARAVVRTAVTDVANEATLETYKQNARIIKSIQLVYSLDSSTCMICVDAGSKTYKVDDPAFPKPALHINCRCTIVSNVDWESVGLSEPEGGTRAARDANGKTIQVPVDTDYDTWLRSQPASVQADVLGRARSEVFRSGQSLADMIRADGGFTTLK
jgi:SPP1 gp7 family putative phage head morphogenesis protein